MTTVILIAILIVLLILACTFGLLRQSGKKGRRKEGAFNDALASIAATNADPSIPLTAEAAAMLQQQYPYLLNDPSLDPYRHHQHQQQHQSLGPEMGGRSSPSVEMRPDGSPFIVRGSPYHQQHQQQMPSLSQQQQQQQQSQQHLSASGSHGHHRHHHHQHASSAHIGSISRTTPIPSPSHHHQQQQQQHAAMAAAVAYLPSPAMDRGACGSAEAEFQNDFIEVFPMQHLEPKPYLN